MTGFLVSFEACPRTSSCRPGWPGIHKHPPCLCLPSAEIKGMCTTTAQQDITSHVKISLIQLRQVAYNTSRKNLVVINKTILLTAINLMSTYFKLQKQNNNQKNLQASK